MKRKHFYSGLVCLFVLAMAGATAKADTVFNLNQSAGNWALPSSGYFGTVDLVQDGSNVDVTVALESGIEFVKTGAGYALEFNLPSSVTTSDLTNISSGFTAGSGSGNSNAFGTFELYAKCSGCGHGASSPLPGPLSFTVDGVSISDFGKNSAGAYFASDVIDKNVSGTPTGLVGSDGPNAPTPVVPEPPTLLLLGTGLILLAGAAKFRAISTAGKALGGI